MLASSLPKWVQIRLFTKMRRVMWTLKQILNASIESSIFLIMYAPQRKIPHIVWDKKPNIEPSQSSHMKLSQIYSNVKPSSHKQVIVQGTSQCLLNVRGSKRTLEGEELLSIQILNAMSDIYGHKPLLRNRLFALWKTHVLTIQSSFWKFGRTPHNKPIRNLTE